MINSKTITINENLYDVELFPALEAFTILDKLEDITKNEDTILKLLSRTMKNKTTINKENINIIFPAGSLTEFNKVIKFVIDANFKDFLEENAIGREKEKEEKLTSMK